MSIATTPPNAKNVDYVTSYKVGLIALNNFEISVYKKEEIFHINRLEVIVNERNEIIALSQSFSCEQQIADVLSEIIDRIIIDNEIKSSPKEKARPLNEQIQLITNKRNEILIKIKEHQIDTAYIALDEDSDSLSRTVEKWTCSDEFRKIISDA